LDCGRFTFAVTHTQKKKIKFVTLVEVTNLNSFMFCLVTASVFRTPWNP